MSSFWGYIQAYVNQGFFSVWQKRYTSISEPNMQTLPVLHIQATNYYDVGKAIGTTFKGWISEYLRTGSEVKTLRNFYVASKGREIYETYLETSSRYYPNVVSEIRGMADGSEQSFEDIFLLQMTSEIEFCHKFEVFDDATQDSGIKGCTDIMINSESSRLMGHNDDWTEDVSGRSYIVHVTICDPTGDGDVNGANIREEFFSYAYPASLAGFCFGMNKDLVLTLNTLMPKRAVRTGVPVQILLRRLLACSTIEACVETMKNVPVGCAYGMSINIAEINGDWMGILEVYPKKSGTEVKFQQLPVGVSSSGNAVHLHHQNHYKFFQDIEEFEGLTVGSRRREIRLNELENPQTELDVRRLLSDTKDDLEPVYVTPNKRHLETNLKTSATAIFNLKER